MHPYQTEQALAAALARREADAAEQLVREYGGLLNAVVRRHAPGLDADDILADALLAIWQNAGRFDGQHSFRAWAAAVARYRAIDAGAPGRAHPPGGRRAGAGAFGGPHGGRIFCAGIGRYVPRPARRGPRPSAGPVFLRQHPGRAGRRARHQRGRCEHAGGPCPATAGPPAGKER